MTERMERVFELKARVDSIWPGFALYTAPLIDTLPFHMAGHVEFEDTTAYNYRAPYLLCSSPEIVVRTITDLGGAGGATYCYATGFNLTRLFDRMGVDYKPRLFAEGELSLYAVLNETLAAENDAR